MLTQAMQKPSLHVFLRLFKSQSSVGFESVENLLEAVASAEACANGAWDTRSIIHRLYRDLAAFGLSEFTQLRSSREKGSLVARKLIVLNELNQRTLHKDISEAMEDAEACAAYSINGPDSKLPRHSAIKGTQGLYRDLVTLGLCVTAADSIKTQGDIVMHQLKKLEVAELVSGANDNFIPKDRPNAINRSPEIATWTSPPTISDFDDILRGIFDQYCHRRQIDNDTLSWKLPPTWIMYVLRLVDNCWYVGITRRSTNERFCEHLDSMVLGAEWTRLHKPHEKPLPPERVPLFETDEYFVFDNDLGYHTEDCAKLMETDVTLALMCLFGREKVRGGEYSGKDTRLPQSLEPRPSRSCKTTRCY